MALVKRTNLTRTSSSHDDDAAFSPHRRLAGSRAAGDRGNGNDDTASVAANSALAEAQKRKARTFARQQKAAERIAAATSQLASGITEASAAAIEMGKAADQIASGAEEAAGASQQSLKAVNAWSGADPQGEGECRCFGRQDRGATDRDRRRRPADRQFHSGYRPHHRAAGMIGQDVG